MRRSVHPPGTETGPALHRASARHQARPRGASPWPVFLLFLCALLLPAVGAGANPQVPQGGSATFPSTASAYSSGPTWQITQGGSAVADSNTPGGWSVAYNGATSPTQFTVGAPAAAAVAANYAVTYKPSTYSPSADTASFDVVASGTVSLSGLTLSPATVVGGNTGGTQSTGTVTLSAAAPSGDVIVSLSSANTAVATVPPTVTVAAGQRTNTFTVSTSGVTAQTTVTITATSSGLTQTATLTVQPWLNTLTIAPASVFSGGTATATLTLNAPAPAGGLPVTLASDNTAAATVPGNLPVPANATSVPFTVQAASVTANASANVTATYAGQSVSQSISVQPVLGYVSLSPSTVTGGSPSTGTVHLNGPAPSGGVTVALSSANAAATVDANLPIPAGATDGTFTVTTGAVSAVTTGNISAAYGGVTRSASLTVNPIQVSVSVSPTSVVGGGTSQGTVTLSGPAPAAGLTVALSSSAPSVAGVSANVLVAAGATSAPFTVTTSSVTAVTSATLTASSGGLSSTATLSVTPLLQGVSVSSYQVASGTTMTGTVTLYAAAPAGGAPVALSTSSAAASVLASVTVPAGATSQTFTVTGGSVVTSTGVTLTATNGGASASTQFSVVPLLSGVSLNPSSVFGGGTSQGTVSLSAGAPSGGAIVALSSDNGAAAVLANVTVPAGATSAPFTVTTVGVSASTAANIAASFGGVTVSQQLTVQPLLQGVSVSPSPAPAGGTATGTVSLSGPAPAGGVTVTLSSSAPSVAGVPANVPVAAGATSAPFTVTTGAVTVDSAATLTASLAGVTQTTSLTVRPLLSGLSLSPSTLVGGDPATGTVTFNLSAPSGTVVNLSSSSPALASVPATLTVGSGGYNFSAQFPVTTSAATAATPVTISATLGGVTVSATLTVGPVPTVQLISVDPSEEAYNATPVYQQGGTQIAGPTSTGTVTLSGVAPAAGAVVTLSSGNATVASAPSDVTVAGGQTQANFTLSLSAVAADTSVTVSGAYNNSSRSGVIIVDRPKLLSLTFDPNTLGGGNGTNGTVSLLGAAPAGGVTINLACAPAAGASLPASVTVPAGATSYVFPVTTSTVNEATLLTFTATNAAFPGDPPVTGTVNLKVATLHNVDLFMPKTIHLEWYLSSVGDFLITRDGVTLGTAPNTATTYDDVFNWTSGQTYRYDLYDNNTPAAPVLLSTEKVTPYYVPAGQAQAVDSRLDPRYSTNVFLDHQFGATAYKGGLFAGYAADPSKVGRSFAQFDLSVSPAGGYYRTGKVNAYFVTAENGAGGPVTMQVGAQALANNAWSAPAFTWDGMLTAFPNLSPVAAPKTVTISYDPSAPSGVIATPGSGQVALTWTPPAGGPSASYTVSYGTYSGYYSSQVTGVTGTSTTITGLANGTTYYFVVAAVSPAGATGPNSLEVSSTPPSSPMSSTPPAVNYWCSWPLKDDILAALQGAGGSHLLTVGWASMSEAQPGWAYFAKSEYDPALGPSVMHAWSLPTLISLQAPGNVALNGQSSTSATGIVTVNAIGLTGSAVVSLSSDNAAVTFVNSANVSSTGTSATMTVTGLARTFQMNVGSGAAGATVTLSATFGGVTKTARMTVAP